MKRRKIVRQMNNAGSTMVEVIVGFVILVMVLAECMVHLLGVSGELVKNLAHALYRHTIFQG